MSKAPLLNIGVSFLLFGATVGTVLGQQTPVAQPQQITPPTFAGISCGTPPALPCAQPAAATNQTAAFAEAVDNVNTWAVAPVDSLVQAGAVASKIPAGGAAFGVIGNVLDFTSAFANYASDYNKRDYSAAAADGAQYLFTTGVKTGVIGFGGAVGGPPGEVVAGTFFSVGQMVQKLPCNGGTVQDCVTEDWYNVLQSPPPTFDEFGVRDPSIAVLSNNTTLIQLSPDQTVTLTPGATAPATSAAQSSSSGSAPTSTQSVNVDPSTQAAVQRVGADTSQTVGAASNSWGGSLGSPNAIDQSINIAVNDTSVQSMQLLDSAAAQNRSMDASLAVTTTQDPIASSAILGSSSRPTASSSNAVLLADTQQALQTSISISAQRQPKSAVIPSSNIMNQYGVQGRGAATSPTQPGNNAVGNNCPIASCSQK